MIIISSVLPASPAMKKGIRAGDQLEAINGFEIRDVLDYRFRITESVVEISVLRNGQRLQFKIKKPLYDDIGLEFSSFLMDEKMRCRNKCVFCFIDQNPPGMRETVYFKDDDTRLSFLMGNYVTLTNVGYDELTRIADMKISPINVSVHATNPELRIRLLGNRFAGDVLEKIKYLGDRGVKLNCQLVICRGLNDADELKRSLTELSELYPAVTSIAVVPAGLTKYREGLYALESFDEASAGDVIDITESFANAFLQKLDTRLCYPADELYITAKRPLPAAEFYEDFPQLDNGVGLLRSEEADIEGFIEDCIERAGELKKRVYTLMTGKAACGFMRGICAKIEKAFPSVIIQVIAVENKFFGETVTVAGLLCGSDYIAAAQIPENAEKLARSDALLIPAVSLRSERDAFLDGKTPEELSRAVGRRVIPVENGGDLVSVIISDGMN